MWCLTDRQRSPVHSDQPGVRYLEKIALLFVLVHLDQRWRVDVQAHSCFDSAIADLVHMPVTQGSQCACDQLSSPWNDPGQAAANLGMPFGEHPAESDEGTGAPAVIMPLGALARQPCQEPSLEFRLAGKAYVVASHWIVGH